MDAQSVEVAFSTIPNVAGIFSWSPANDAVTFIPQGSGFPPQTMIDLRVAGTAKDSVAGNRLPGGFESRFQTGGR